MKFSREVIIVSTSVLGGALAGLAVAKLAELEEIPYGIGLSLVFAALGMLVQFATNKPADEDEDEETESTDETDEPDETEERDTSEIYETEVDETWQKKRKPTR
jgi:hypothetical protein